METSDEVARLRAQVSELQAQVRAGKEAAAMLGAVLEAVPAFVVRASAEGRISFINRVYPDMSLESVLGTSVYDWIAPSSHGRVRQAIEQAQTTGAPQSFEAVGRGETGRTRDFRFHVSPLGNDSGAGFVLAAFDVSDLRERERALQESEASLRLAIEATGLGLWTWDMVADRVTWNEPMHRLCGVDEPMTPVAYCELVHPEDRPAVEALMRKTLKVGYFEGCVHRIVRPDGAVRWMLSLGRVLRDADGRVATIVGGQLDLTDQRRNEERLRHGQKMEALGQLTAGVAHNFNNMLAVILPTLQGVEGLVPDERRPLVRAALMAGQRAEELVRRMVQLAGERSGHERRTLLIEELVRRSVEICRRAFGQEIEMIERYEAPEVGVCVAPGDIEQTLVNLLLNARDALAGAPSPRIVVEVQRSEAPGWARIRISDNGCGMSPEVQARIFEPFFTTKEPGRGTGLGLATAYASLRDHGGDIVCQSERGVGTSFTLRLPTRPEAAPRDASRSERPPPAVDGPTLLVIDDEPALCQALGWVLGEAGYRVLSAGTADEGLAALARAPGVALALVDRSMPGGLSPAALGRMRELAPGIRLLLHTGNEPPGDLVRLVDGVLLKPTRREGLLRAIDEQLRRPRPELRTT